MNLKETAEISGSHIKEKEFLENATHRTYRNQKRQVKTVNYIPNGSANTRKMYLEGCHVTTLFQITKDRVV